MADERQGTPRAPRRLPAAIRYALVVILGAVVAVLSSYMLRKIGF